MLYSEKNNLLSKRPTAVVLMSSYV